MKRIYLDYAATTPVAPEVEKAMRPYQTKIFGNPGSTHFFGQQASAAVFKARQIVSRALNYSHEEVVFTGSATEANNLALRVVVAAVLRNQNTFAPAAKVSSPSARHFLLRSDYNKKTKLARFRDVPQDSRPLPKLIISAIEHESILETARDLERQGVEVVYLPVDKNGLVDLKKIKAAVDERTALISIQYANSEIGVIQPIKEIVSIVKSQMSNVLVHTDAVQALQFLDCDVEKLGVDMMTLSAHKIYGPKGIGVLYIRSLNPKPYTLNPFITGGGQEFGWRSGTENVAGIVGFGAAAGLNEKFKVKNEKLRSLRNYLWQGIKKIVPEARINGPDIKSNSRLPNNLNIYFPGRPAQDLAIELDLWGVSVSPGTACSSRSANPSYVIAALGYRGDRPKSSLRFTLGRPTTKVEINQVLAICRKRFLH